LNLASADGGGDFPEAPDQALAKAAELSWRATDNTARLAFWVADAPHHPENAAAMSAAIGALHEHAVHVYPVASSGVDELTELTMRSRLNSPAAATSFSRTIPESAAITRNRPCPATS
jgi:sirohydrochlorin ferrochelatase